jgi:hypothetical protein
MTAMTFMSSPHFGWSFAPLTARACIRGGRGMAQVMRVVPYDSGSPSNPSGPFPE